MHFFVPAFTLLLALLSLETSLLQWGLAPLRLAFLHTGLEETMFTGTFGGLEDILKSKITALQDKNTEYLWIPEEKILKSSQLTAF